MGVPGQLPEIAWEKTRVVEVEAVAAPAPKGGTEAGTTAVAKGEAGKTEKTADPAREGRRPEAGKETGKGRAKAKPRLDVFDRAAESRKPVLLYFTADRCNLCRTMEKLLLRQKPVVDAAKGYHSVLISTDHAPREVLEAYKVKEAPTLILFTYDGVPGARFVGREDPDRLAAVFQKVVEENGKKVREAEKAQADPETSSNPRVEKARGPRKAREATAPEKEKKREGPPDGRAPAGASERPSR